MNKLTLDMNKKMTMLEQSRAEQSRAEQSRAEQSILIRQATKKGYISCINGGLAELSYLKSKTRRGRVQGDGRICPTITCNSEVHRVNSPYEIYKLTPRETWRMMNFSDKDFEKAEKVTNKGNLYKQAGNSIVVNVLVAIFGQMIDGKEDVYKEIEND